MSRYVDPQTGLPVNAAMTQGTVMGMFAPNDPSWDFLHQQDQGLAAQNPNQWVQGQGWVPKQQPQVFGGAPSAPTNWSHGRTAARRKLGK